jgi:hypothetical protein
VENQEVRKKYQKVLVKLHEMGWTANKISNTFDLPYLEVFDVVTFYRFSLGLTEENEKKVA